MATRTSTEPSYVAEQRVRKAADFAVALRRLGVTPDDVARFTEADRRMAEDATGIGKRSDKTWDLTIGMLAGSAQVTCPYCYHGDPQGVPGPPLPFQHDGPCRP